MEITKTPEKEHKKDLKQALEEQLKLTNEYKNDLQILQAEFENYKKRIEKEHQELAKFSNVHLIKKLLPLLDDFDQALNTSTANVEDLKKGLQLLHLKFKKILEEEGLREMKTTNEKFDPHKHEVLLQEVSDKEPETIVEELQKGYFIHDKILRHAKVKIAKQLEENIDNKTIDEK